MVSSIVMWDRVHYLKEANKQNRRQDVDQKTTQSIFSMSFRKPLIYVSYISYRRYTHGHRKQENQ